MGRMIQQNDLLSIVNVTHYLDQLYNVRLSVNLSSYITLSSYDLQISRNLLHRRIQSNAIRQAISKDENDIRTLLRSLLVNQNERAAIMSLEEWNAMSFIASVQKVSNHVGVIPTALTTVRL
jgi:hypothetical protein